MAGIDDISEERLIRLAYYPYLPAVGEEVASFGTTVAELLMSTQYETARTRARERVMGVIEEGVIPTANIADRFYAMRAFQEVTSVAIARMLVVALQEKRLVQLYAEAEAERMVWFLERETDPEVVFEVAQAFGCPVRIEEQFAIGTSSMAVKETKSFSVDLPTYLNGANFDDPRWKLVLRVVNRGWVVVSQKEVPHICRHLFVKRIRERLDQELTRKLDSQALDALDSYIQPLDNALDKLREKWNTGDFGPVQPDLFPPCIKEVFEALKRRENVPHHGRFALATFLNTIGWGSEQILDYLSATPNFDREKSRYQIEHVTGQKGVGAYTPPGCATMQTNGVCPLDKRDSVCFTIKHPLGYYRKQLRRQQWHAQRSAAAAQPPIAPIPPNPTDPSVKSVESVARPEARP